MNERTPESIENPQPPLEWFAGIGKKDGGIRAIAFSDKFYASLGDRAEEIKSCLMEWSHYTTNHFVAEASVCDDPRVKDILERMESAIQEATGFTARQLADYQSTLWEKYGGTDEAPFDVELY